MCNADREALQNISGARNREEVCVNDVVCRCNTEAKAAAKVEARPSVREEANKQQKKIHVIKKQVKQQQQKSCLIVLASKRSA